VFDEVHCVGPSDGSVGTALCKPPDFIGTSVDPSLGIGAFEELLIG
jgi:hypothetical protein